MTCFRGKSFLCKDDCEWMSHAVLLHMLAATNGPCSGLVFSLFLILMKKNWVAAAVQTRDRRSLRTWSTLSTRQESFWQCLKTTNLTMLNRSEWRYGTLLVLRSRLPSTVPWSRAVVHCPWLSSECLCLDSTLRSKLWEGKLSLHTQLWETSWILILYFLLWKWRGFPSLDLTFAIAFYSIQATLD